MDAPGTAILIEVKDIGEEGGKKLPDPIHLQDEATEGPAHDNQENACKVRSAALPLFTPEEELESLRCTQQHAKPHEECNIPECQKGPLEEEAHPQDYANETDAAQTNADLLVVVKHRGHR
eukprot:CAMPEP_0179191096 /NCGR_PEP_ID=MMETSP0796-20121207/94909_1 /TAXON_ID=73915 /ORGANISM="Pyrodinium bahamense, Strain pbaha01" /LENGTH=120 /DNA_ID=CAMNT_0020895307 /DNA_START=151 /DNA_END=512 /DNA_ORIENTATION=-